MAKTGLFNFARKVPLLNKPEEDSETIKARDFLGVDVSCSRAKSRNGRRFAIIYSNLDNVGRAIAIHKTDSQLLSYTHTYISKSTGKEVEEKTPGLFKVFSHTKDATFLIRALPTNYAFFAKHIQGLIPTVNDNYAGFLRKVERYGNPQKINDEVKTIEKSVGRDLWIWTQAEDMIPTSDEDVTASLHGTLVGYNETGNIIRSSLFRKPASFKAVDADPVTKVVNHYSYAAPRNPVFYNDRISFGEKCFAYWLGEITPENIESLLALNLDILFRMRVVDKFLYMTSVIRAEAPKSKANELDENTELLNEHYGKWERLKGTDLEQAFHCFIPGSAPLPDNWFYTGLIKSTYKTILGAIPPALKPVSDPNGIEILGKVGHETLLEDPRSKPGQLITGESKTARKSGTTAFRALALLPPLWIPLSSTVGDTNEFWGETYSEVNSIDWNILVGQQVQRKFVEGESFLLNTNGNEPKKRVMELFLPDALDIIGARAQSSGVTKQTSKNEVYELQEALHEEDRKHAQAVAQMIFNSWDQYGYPVGRPITFKILSGQTTRLLNWYDWYLKEYREQHEAWFRKTGYHDLMVFDNFSTLFETFKRGEDPYLRQLSSSVALNLATRIVWFLNNGANIGLLTWVITHTIHDFDWITPSAYFNMALSIEMGYNNGEIAHVISPRDGEVITDRAVVILEPTFSDIFQRQEPSGGAKGFKVPATPEANLEQERYVK
jgi:hypothetical protein